MDCAFLDDGYCSAAAVEFDPDNGCATYAPSADSAQEDEWDEEEEIEEWEELEDEEEEEEDIWMDEEEE
jgi:hypothetical protein